MFALLRPCLTATTMRLLPLILLELVPFGS
jgi:hypothetical protein